MKIVNRTHYYDIIINGTKIHPGEEYVVGESIFNSQAIYSDIGSIEIVTEYGKRYFRNYGNLKAYEDDNLKDINKRSQIIVTHTIPQNLYKEK